jgi:hypothetical protein
MDLNDEKHIMKTALEFFAKICDTRNHQQLSRKCKEMASDLTCDPKTECIHNTNA